MHAGVHLRTVRQRGIQASGDRGGGDVLGAENNSGKLRRV